ncbi:MAG: hypothetical protein R6V18_01925 [Desulfuromonadaceae bacterium]
MATALGGCSRQINKMMPNKAMQPTLLRRAADGWRYALKQEAQ